MPFCSKILGSMFSSLNSRSRAVGLNHAVPWFSPSSSWGLCLRYSIKSSLESMSTISIATLRPNPKPTRKSCIARMSGVPSVLPRTDTETQSQEVLVRIKLISCFEELPHETKLHKAVRASKRMLNACVGNVRPHILPRSGLICNHGWCFLLEVMFRSLLII